MPEQHTSVPTVVRTLFRMVDGADSPQLCSGTAPSPNQFSRDEGQLQGRVPDAVLHTLARIEKKLDTVISLLNKDNFERNFPHKAFATRLSASSFIMECKEPLAPGDHLEVVLFLEEIPTSLAAGIARVDSKLTRKAQTDKDFSVYTLSFVSIRDEDKEAVIRHVFQEERKIIRQQKSDNY